ncbi:hypothetical protein [Enterobacter hormaechei]|uniref:hypothetical protein n=1 Tax=Enterobacter hormaechei TaxID=158836 RepID=UPI0007A81A45|nr:hypothetical protein [Enterobacter hormaechei]SAI93525.1 Uncharacterised protein [Enterobacter hormaechei]
MKSTESTNVKDLVARLKEIQEHSDITIPEWMLDEQRYGNGSLTLEEQHEWAETVVHSMRGTAALLYLIQCEKRWGLREGAYQFRSGEFVFGLTRELIESVLIEHVENTLLETRTDRYIAVYQFYSANDQQRNETGWDWFTDILDEIFTSLADRLRGGDSLPEKQLLH